MLRYSVRVSSPGCVAMVLEAVSPRPPYLLENRTRHLLQFRPLGAVNAPFQSLPPYAAAGFAPSSPATPAMVGHFWSLAFLHCLSDTSAASEHVQSIYVK